MGDNVQLVFVLMWEPADRTDPRPFEFAWIRDVHAEPELMRSLLADLEPALEWMVYSGVLPLPTDGDFATDSAIEHSLRYILAGWTRGEAPPIDQVSDGHCERVARRKDR